MSLIDLIVEIVKILSLSLHFSKTIRNLSNDERSEQTFAGQDEWMEELPGDEYYVELFAEIAESEPITEAIDEVTLSRLF